MFQRLNGYPPGTSLHHPSDFAPAPETAHTLLSTTNEQPELLPLSKQMRWFGQAIGGLVRGGIYLLAGQPGSRKSGLAMQLGLDLAKRGHPCLFLVNEEPAARLRQRADHMMHGWPESKRSRALANLHVDEDLFDLECLPALVTHRVLRAGGPHHGVEMLVLDSIQGHGLHAGATRKFARLYEAVRLCQAAGVVTLLIGHVTKRDLISGPRDLEHNVDVVLLLRRAFGCRPLFVPKNRFGAATTKPLPLELDPVTTRLRPSPHARPQTSVAKTFLGGGLGLAEVQASVTIPPHGERGRVLSSGLPRREVEQLVACIGHEPSVDIGGLDFTIHCRLPGERSYRPTMGLALSLSLLSSYLQRPIPTGDIYIGEIDLCRSVRELPVPVLDDLRAALELGELGGGGRLLCPRGAASSLRHVSDVEIVPCTSLSDAIRAAWPDLATKGS